MRKSKNTTRHLAREQAFQILYGLSFSPAKTRDDLVKAFLESLHAAKDVQDPAAEPSGFAWELVEGVWTYNDSLDETIARYSRNWKVDRIGRIEITLLRLAVFELLFRNDVPPKVVMNEALDLSAQFGDGTANKFINGILDSVAKALENGEVTAQTREAH
ncbi:MAG: transcription antitermination factor NusB [Desulfovibrio sp.]|nr:transcription antitermination factor NusB [Desulfovibrio sp.]